ncbi:MAG TPA: thiamine biosynthesis protein ThiF [Desulfovibrio sp.]|nr:thiamine biosynthesis protein ThiF [Desulfovibrio sp.]
MSKEYILTFTEEQHLALKAHFYAGDGKEGVAFAVCGQCEGAKRHRLLVQEIIIVPNDSCSFRSDCAVTWSTDLIEPLLDKIEGKRLSVVKIHNHPNGLSSFSEVDDQSDSALLSALNGYLENEVPHGSAIMLANGHMFGRIWDKTNEFISLTSINVVGDDLHYWYSNQCERGECDFTASHAQLFGKGTTERLRELSVAIVGCSGTGSPLAEQLARLGVKRLTLIDDDIIEARNVNRIYNSTMDDVEAGKKKVELIKCALDRIGIETDINAIPYNLWDPRSVKAVAECDIVFGCMDSVDGRYLLNFIATYYMLPYFDIGIRLEADPTGLEQGAIREVCGTIHYLQPGRSSLVSRGLFSMDDVSSAGLRRVDPQAYSTQEAEGYISGVVETSPAVISVNTLGASLAVNELLSRLHPYREEGNSEYSQVIFSLSSMEIFGEPEDNSCLMFRDKVGVGDITPLLGMPELSVRSR